MIIFINLSNNVYLPISKITRLRKVIKILHDVKLSDIPNKLEASPEVTIVTAA